MIHRAFLLGLLLALIPACSDHAEPEQSGLDHAPRLVDLSQVQAELAQLDEARAVDVDLAEELRRAVVVRRLAAGLLLIDVADDVHRARLPR